LEFGGSHAIARKITFVQVHWFCLDDFDVAHWDHIVQRLDKVTKKLAGNGAKMPQDLLKK
jgi:hypothetical protein